jgi:hypothetical protein
MVGGYLAQRLTPGVTQPATPKFKFLDPLSMLLAQACMGPLPNVSQLEISIMGGPQPTVLEYSSSTMASKIAVHF